MIELKHSRNLAARPCAGCFLGVFLLPVLITTLGLIPDGRVTAQTFTTLHSFTANSDGILPDCGLHFIATGQDSNFVGRKLGVTEMPTRHRSRLQRAGNQEYRSPSTRQEVGVRRASAEP